jgi:hypothetical protein
VKYSEFERDLRKLQALNTLPLLRKKRGGNIVVTTHTWFGGTGQFIKPNNWDPTGVPASGDTAAIESGTVKLSDQGLSGVMFILDAANADSQPTLALRNVALDDRIAVSGVFNPGDFSNGTPVGEINARGVVTSAGQITTTGGRGAPFQSQLVIDIERGGTFVNTGSIRDMSFGDSLTIKGDGSFFNNGTVATAENSVADIAAKVVGTGTFDVVGDLQGGSAIHFGDGVSAGITVDLVLSPVPLKQHIIIDKPLQFLAAIDNFDSGGLGGRVASLNNDIDLPNTKEARITSDTFADDHLQLFAGSKLLADLNIIGDFTAGNFALSADAKGGTLITFAPTTATATSDPPSIVPSMAAHA